MADQAVSSSYFLESNSVDPAPVNPGRNLRWAGCSVNLHDIEKQLEVEFPPNEGVKDDSDPILKSSRGGLGVVRKGRVVDGSEYITVVVKFRRFNIDAFLYHERKVQITLPAMSSKRLTCKLFRPAIC